MSNIVALRRRVPVLALGALVALTPAVALAHGAGGHTGGHGHFSHHSNKANANTNGKNSTDRDKGHARAEDRMNQHGLNHNNAGITDTDDTTTSGGG